MIKRLIIAVVLLIVVCGGIVGFNMFRDKAIAQYFATMKQPPSTVSTVKVEPMKWTPGIEAIGTVGASRGVDLTVETTGIIKEIQFTANQRVERNAVLIQMDDAVQRADLDAARTQAKLDQQALQRAQELQQKGVGTESTLDAARAAAESSASQVAKLQAVLDQKQLRAPYSGVMGIPKVELGQYLQPGTLVATLQNLDTMRADFSVPEQQLGQLKIGQKVTFGLSEGDRSFNGSITGIEPKVDPASRLVSVRSEIVDPNGRLSPGQFVQVRVELPEENNVLALPQTALTTSLYGDYIFVVHPAKPAPAAAAAGEKPAADLAKPTEGDAKPAPETSKDAKPDLVLSQVFVKPGRRNQGLVEILDGLKAGDEVVTAGQNRLFNGMPVVVDNTVDLTKPANQQASAQ